MKVKLPDPELDGQVSLEQCLYARRSIRHFGDTPLSLQELSQLVWAAQGTTSPDGFRTCPSAGALYPMETLVIAGNIQQLKNGVYRYQTGSHELTLIQEGDIRPALTNASLQQPSIQSSPANIVFTAIFNRTTWK